MGFSYVTPVRIIVPWFNEWRFGYSIQFNEAKV